jgi:hypothetical protein
MGSSSLSRKVIFGVFVLLAVAVAAVALSTWLAGSVDPGTLVWFDDDISDSALGWAIAIPVLVLTAITAAVVLAGTGAMVVVALAISTVVAIVAVLFALLLVFLPFAIFIAIPILAVVGLVKLMSKPARAPNAN